MRKECSTFAVTINTVCTHYIYVYREAYLCLWFGLHCNLAKGEHVSCRIHLLATAGHSHHVEDNSSVHQPFLYLKHDKMSQAAFSSASQIQCGLGQRGIEFWGAQVGKRRGDGDAILERCRWLQCWHWPYITVAKFGEDHNLFYSTFRNMN